MSKNTQYHCYMVLIALLLLAVLITIPLLGAIVFILIIIFNDSFQDFLDLMPIKKKRKYVDYNEYIKSEKWRAKREERLSIDEYECQHCGSQNQLEVHHLTYDRLGAESMNDLKTLCKPCHKKEHQ